MARSAPELDLFLAFTLKVTKKSNHSVLYIVSLDFIPEASGVGIGASVGAH